jgi:murein L,D-transpeptidase YcbB/YkuD
MTIAGADYAFTHPDTSSLRAAGIGFVCRYLSTDPSKNLTGTELSALHSAGISVVLNWETTAQMALRGYQGGLSDARTARAQAQALGAPSSTPIYYSVDFDATLAQISTVLDYLHGAADAEGSKDLVGVYGGYDTVAATINAGFKYAWQTFAWSGTPTRWHDLASIRQTEVDQWIGGVQVDLDEAMFDGYGQWPASATPPQPSNLPVLREGASGPAVLLLQRSVMLAGEAPGATDSSFGPRTLAALRGFQSGHGLAVDGICGPLTWAALIARTKIVQTALDNHGARLAVDGIAGPLTMNALTHFQMTRGLVADGIVGPHTSAALGIN